MALSRTAKLLVSGAAAKWQRVRQAMLQDAALGAALQRLAEELAPGDRRGPEAAAARARCTAFQFTFDCELCAGLQRRPFAQLHRAVSSTSVTSAVLVVFDIYSETHTFRGGRSTPPPVRRAWHAHTLDRRLHRLSEIERAVEAAGAGSFARAAATSAADSAVACLRVSGGARARSAREHGTGPFRGARHGRYLAWARRHCTQSASRALSLFLRACEAGEEGVLVKPMWGTWSCTQDIKLKEGLVAPRDASPYRYRYRFCYRQRQRQRQGKRGRDPVDNSSPARASAPAACCAPRL